MVTDTRDEIKKAIIENREEPPRETGFAPGTHTEQEETPATKDLQAAPGSQIDPERLRESIELTEVRKPYDAIIKTLEAERARRAPEDEETRRKRERRERSRRIIGAVSDGLRALGNLYFTSQYAPDMYKGSTRQLDKANELIERAKAQRDKDADEYFNLSMKIGDKEAEKAKTLRDIEAQQEARRQARKLAEQKAAEHAAKMKLYPYKEDEARAKAEGAGYDTQRKKAIADATPEQERIKTANLELEGKVKASQIDKNRAQAVKAWKEGKKPFHFDGKEYYKDNENDYLKAITSAVDEVNNYFAKRDSAGKIMRDNRGNVIFRDDYEPISVAYDNLNGETKYFVWAETAGKAERALDKMRKEQQEQERKEKSKWSLKSPESGKWSLK